MCLLDWLLVWPEVLRVRGLGLGLVWHVRKRELARHGEEPVEEPAVFCVAVEVEGDRGVVVRHDGCAWDVLFEVLRHLLVVSWADEDERSIALDHITKYVVELGVVRASNG